MKRENSEGIALKFTSRVVRDHEGSNSILSKGVERSRCEDSLEIHRTQRFRGQKKRIIALFELIG